MVMVIVMVMVTVTVTVMVMVMVAISAGVSLEKGIDGVTVVSQLHYSVGLQWCYSGVI
jgi:hypothetical protein